MNQFLICSQFWLPVLFICIKGADLPELQEEESDPIKDVGLKGLVITGEESETENDLIRYSNYISGAGSTFGGFMAGLPADIKDLTEGRNDIRPVIPVTIVTKLI